MQRQACTSVAESRSQIYNLGMRIILVTQKGGTGKSTLTTALAVADARSKLLAFLVLVGLALALPVARVSELTYSPISCERHHADFSNDFSPDFDINSVDCRVPWIKSSPTIRFWGVPPYVGISGQANKRNAFRILLTLANSLPARLAL
jgi:hypothetical protein